MCEIFKQVLEERETKRKYILGKIHLINRYKTAGQLDS